jgi:uncharacterized protein YifE (UPF0438 family)
MGLPADHAALLRQQDFVIPATEALSQRERLLLLRYGRWLEALSSGRLCPLTPEQEQFVRVARGSEAPSTEFEHAWVKFLQMQSQARDHDPLAVASRCARLAQARRSEAAVQAEYQQRHAAVMEQVRSQLEALDTEFSERLRAANEEVGRLEADVKKVVLQLGQSVKHEGIHAVYARGRVSWDTRGLDGYAETHPEVQEFRKVGAPSVSVRYQLPEPVGLTEKAPPLTDPGP